MKFLALTMRLIAPLVVMCCLFGASSQVAQAQMYTNISDITHFTAPITSYATFSNYSGTTGCTAAAFTPTSAELLATSCRVFSGTLAGNGLPTLPAGQNWILASFSDPVSNIVVFPNIDHFGSAYDGFQYKIAGSNDGANWTMLYDATSVNGAAEPFTLGGSTGTAPSSVNNVLTPQGASIEPCSGTVTKCQVGYIATFQFPTAYQFYAFGASSVAIAQGNPDQELSAIGTIAAPRIGTFPPTSGAMLTIDGTIGMAPAAIITNCGTPLAPLPCHIYDSQIHTGTVRQVPVGSGVSNCNASDRLLPTDAYVLQGGSWTGCDPGDAFEFQASGHATVSGPGYSFAITTSYNGPQCNTNNTICVGAGASTGFLTIKNNNGAAFSVAAGQTGITLSGTPVSLTATNAAFCPPASGASDNIKSLAAGATATLALSTDSSFCGGFNAPQTEPLVAGSTSIFPIGNDNYQITPFNSVVGDALTVLPVPVPAGPLGLNTWGAGHYGTEAVAFPTSTFSPGTNFPGQACIAYDDLSATGNPVCLEFQVSCLNGGVNCSDALTYLYTSQINFTKDHNSLTTIGGTAFLGEHSGTPMGYGGQCPNTGFNFNLNVFFSYTATAPDPIRGGGTGSNCYVGTFDPTAAPVPVGSTLTQETFVGFQSPVVNCTGIFPAPCGNMNLIQRGRSVPLIFQSFRDSASTVPVTNLTLCPTFDGTGCPVPPNPAGTPWVFIGTIPVNCATDAPLSTSLITATTPGTSGFQNLGAAGVAPAGTYQLNLDTTNIPTPTGCFTPVFGFSTGFWTFDAAEFKFKQ